MAAAWSIRRVTAAEPAPPVTGWAIRRLTAAGDLPVAPASPVWTIRGLTVAGDNPARPMWRIRGLTAAGDIPVGMVATGPGRVVAGGETATLSIAGSDGAAMDTVTVKQLNGNQVTMFGTGKTRTFTAPYDPRGIVLSFNVTGVRAGVSSTATVTVQVAPHAWWGCYGDPIAWRPLQPLVSDSTQWALATARQ